VLILLAFMCIVTLIEGVVGMNKMYVWVITAITLILLPVSLFAQAPDTVWTRRYNGPSNDNEFAAGCAVDGSGNIYVTGTYPIGGHEEYLIIKYNADGDTLWIRQYYNPAYSWNIVRACAVDSSGNLYVTGCGNDNYLTVKFNSAGDTL
jgi:outer membrane protein assembly factor BamB